MKEIGNAFKSSLPSSNEVSESGLLRSVLQEIRKPLIKSVHNFSGNASRSILRRLLIEMQPPNLERLLVLPELVVETKHCRFQFKFEIRQADNLRLSHGRIRTDLE